MTLPAQSSTTSCSTSSSSTPTAYDSTHSRHDQLYIKINAKQLESTSLYQGVVYYNNTPVTADNIKNMKADNVMHLVNTYASQGKFLPLSFWSKIIKKFADYRIGTYEEALALYELVKAKYCATIFDQNCKEALEVHNEMMLVYIRKDSTQVAFFHQPLLAIYKAYQHPWNYNAMMEYFNAIKAFEETKQWFLQRPSTMPQDGWSYKFYLEAVLETQGIQECRRLLSPIQDPKVLHNEEFAVFYMKHRFDPPEIASTVQYFNQLPSTKKSDPVCRALLKAYFRAQKIQEATMFFDAWPVAKLAPTYAVMIQKLAPQNADQAERVYECALQQNDLFKTVFKETRILRRLFLQLNLHCTLQMGGGGTSYKPFHFDVVTVMLQHLYKKVTALHTSKNPPANVTIKIITGQGKAFQLRDSIYSFVKEKFGWQLYLGSNDGCLQLSAPLKNLTLQK